ncbi:MAG: helix-turn-helix transcriptional regulator [Phascolarctobacterium sp.]|nr:helix-turn-helix transcriptional regulator [Phascolarctobacterium sp.]
MEENMQNENGVKLETFVVERIDELCAERKMSKYKLCQLTGIAQSSLSTMARGKTLPSITTLAKLCEGLGISVFDFFNRDPEAIVITNEDKLILKYWHELNDNQKKVLLAFAKGIIIESELK